MGLHCTTSGWESAAAASCWPTCTDPRAVIVGCVNKSLQRTPLGHQVGPLDQERVLSSQVSAAVKEGPANKFKISGWWTRRELDQQHRDDHACEPRK